MLEGNWDAVILELLTKRCVPGLNGLDREKQALKAGGIFPTVGSWGKFPFVSPTCHISHFLWC